MALVLTEEQSLLKESAKGFFDTKAPPAEHRKLRDTADADGFSRALWKEMAEMGFAGVIVPESHGGVGFGYVGAGLIAEQAGRNLTHSPMLSTAILGATALLKGGTDAQKAALLPKIADGSLLLALASDEAARHRPNQVATKAEPSGNGFKLTGTKSHVLDGHVADKLIVAARTSGADSDRDGITLFLVDRAAAGVATKRTLNVDANNAAEIKLDGVQVAGEDVLGQVGQGYALLNQILDAGRVGLAAEMLGVSSQSFDQTVDYLKQREQFGKKIGEFQALQHRAAHLFCELELARSVVLKALIALDDGDIRAGALASLAKAKLGEVAKLATNEAVQMHGGIGMTDDFDIGFYMKRARAAGETFGDASFHGDRLARLMGY
jgi:alkylation response protein AidB-like acyl-CoA dehydrogenase